LDSLKAGQYTDEITLVLETTAQDLLSKYNS
jgi:hypothetical protein